MSGENEILERIKERKQAIHNILQKTVTADGAVLTSSILLVGESLEDYLERALSADKTLEGLLKDINASLERIADEIHNRPLGTV